MAKVFLPLQSFTTNGYNFPGFLCLMAQSVAHFSAATVNPIETLMSEKDNLAFGLCPNQAEKHPADYLIFLLANSITQKCVNDINERYHFIVEIAETNARSSRAVKKRDALLLTVFLVALLWSPGKKIR